MELPLPRFTRPHALASALALTTLPFASLLLGCAQPAKATHPGGDHHDSPRNRASFQVEAVREIANDWATARLTVLAEGKDPALVASQVNKAMTEAVAKSKREKKVEVRTGAYVTQPMYDDGRIVRWQARQELRLESADVDRLSKLIGTLQGDSVQLSGIDFSVRRETRAALEDELIKEALGLFRARAKLVAEGMGAADWSLIDVSVGSHGGPTHRVMMARSDMMMARAEQAPPAFEAGTSEIRVQVSGVVELD